MAGNTATMHQQQRHLPSAFLAPSPLTFKGTKGRRSSGGAAEAAALLLNSDDSFGLPKTSKGPPEVGSTTKKSVSPSYPYSEHSQDNSSSKFFREGADHDGGKLERHETTLESSAISGRSRGRTHSRDEDKYRNSTTSAGTSPFEGPDLGKADIGLDFDSPDEADDLLRLTDPATLSATTTPAKRPDATAAISWRGRTRTRRLDPTVAEFESEGSGPAVTPRRRSPSPPSRPRIDRSKDRSQSPDINPRRFHSGRGASQAGTAAGAAHGETSGGASAGLEGVFALGRTGGVVRDSGGSEDTVGEARTPFQARLGVSGKTESQVESASRGSGAGMSPSENIEVGAKRGIMAESVRFGASESEATIRERGQSQEDDPLSRSSATAPATSSGVSRRSALTRGDKPRFREARSRGVTFDDDLGGIDALDILPSSDDDGKPAAASPPLTPDLGVPTASLVSLPAPSIDGHGVSSIKGTVEATGATGTLGRPNRRGGDSVGHNSMGLSLAAASARDNKRRSTSITAGLSPEAALLMAEDSSGEEKPSSASALSPPLGLGIGPESYAGATAKGVAQGPHAGELANSSTGVGGDIMDDAKLDLALGFMPSAMEGGRKPRRTLPSGGRRRGRVGASEAAGISHAASPAATVNHAPTAIPPKVVVPTTTSSRESSSAFAAGINGVEFGKEEGAENDGTARQDQDPSSSTFPVVGKHRALSAEASAFTEMPSVARSDSLGVPPGKNNQLASDVALLVERDGREGGVIGARGRVGSNAAVSKPTMASVAGVDPSVLASLERQLVLLSSDREAAAARFGRDEQRLQREVEEARGMSAASETRASQLETQLATARCGRSLRKAGVGERKYSCCC